MAQEKRNQKSNGCVNGQKHSAACHEGCDHAQQMRRHCLSAQKKQNTRRSLAENVHKIYAAGMMVLAGFIVGFDTEEAGVADGMIECIEATSIPVCMIGLLTALPGTQLTRRLEKEGRLLPFQNMDGGDQCTSGLNFVPLRPRWAVLEDYKAVLTAVYQPGA